VNPPTLQGETSSSGERSRAPAVPPGEAEQPGATDATGSTEVLPRRAPPSGTGARFPGSRSSARVEATLTGAGRWLIGPVGTTLLCAAILSVVAFTAGGGLSLDSMTDVEIALTIASGLIVAAALIVRAARMRGAARASAAAPVTAPASVVTSDATHPPATPPAVAVAAAARSAPAGGMASEARKSYGLWSVVLLVAFAALTALSAVWSVEPDASWQDAARVFAYSGVFAAAVALAQVAPRRWTSILGAVTLAAIVVSTYALLTKIFPAQLAASEAYARLQQPYGYWNATGLTAAMGAIGCLWLGARRDGHALLRALAYPAMGLQLTALLLTYSRGALAALAIGLIVWFCIVPLRLRGAAVLIAGALGAAVVVAFDFASHALSTEGVPLAQRASAGHQLGVLLAGVLILLTAAGLAIGFLTAKRAPSLRVRRLAGTTVLALLVVALLALVGGLSATHRGVSGTISHDWNTLTNPNAKTPENTPNRLTAIASVRARYWKEALQIFEAHPALGAGAGGYATARLRYRTETLNVKQAHGFVVQTLAELGLVGLALAVALLAAWAVAAGRSTHPLDRRWRAWRWARHPLPYTPERIGLLSMLALVVVFGAHSLVDWTWYVPGDACIALLCAGWLAGRGPLDAVPAASVKPVGPRVFRARLRVLGPRELGLAATIVALALLAAWAEWQPERSANTSEHALALLGRRPAAARSAAQTAVSEDPLSIQALQYLAAVQEETGERARATSTLQKAVRLQPANPQSWAALGEHYLQLADYQAAVQDFRATAYLNPEMVAPEPQIVRDPELLGLRNAYLLALRGTGR
jgi:O-antigen ligase